MDILVKISVIIAVFTGFILFSIAMITKKNKIIASILICFLMIIIALILIAINYFIYLHV